MHQIPNDEKLRELILYISKKSESDPKFGAVKLNKLLFYSDFGSFWVTGSSITGQEYERLQHGPAPRSIMPTINQLISENSLDRVATAYAGKRQFRTVAKRDPDMSLFSADEIARVDRIIAFFSEDSGTAMSQRSHKFAGWKLAENGETIPYDVVRVGAPRLPTKRELEWALSMKDKATECLARKA